MNDGLHGKERQSCTRKDLDRSLMTWELGLHPRPASSRAPHSCCRCQKTSGVHIGSDIGRKAGRGRTKMQVMAFAEWGGTGYFHLLPPSVPCSTGEKH